MFKNIFKILFLILIFSVGIWAIFGFPPIFKQQKANALNQVTNWGFATTTNWTTVNGTSTNVCGTSTTGTGTAFITLAWTNTLGNPSPSWQAVSSSTKGTVGVGEITQTFTVPGSGTVLANAQFDYFASSSSWSTTANSSWIRVDLYDSSNSTYQFNLGCASFNANVAWTSSTAVNNVALTGGTTYTIRVSFKAANKSTAAGSVTEAVDNIKINTAPTGVSSSATAGTTTVSLSWATSTAASGAIGLLNYGVYRGGTRIATSTTNSYSDTSVTGNTTYNYNITNVDASSTESPYSATTTILTIPDVPGTPTYASVSTSTLTVNWTAPTGGSPNYYLERATGTTSTPSTFLQIATTTTNTYNDSGLSNSTIYWYRERGWNATGIGPYSGYSSTTTLSNITVTCTPNISTTSLGILTSGSVSTANPQATTSVSTNNPTGMTLYINGLNAGLINATSSYLINSTGTTLAAGTEGYGAQGTSSAGIVVVSAYNKTGNAVGAIPTAQQTLATSSATTSANVMTNILASIGSFTPAGAYSDTITYSCTAP